MEEVRVTLLEQHSKFLSPTLQVFYMCTLCDTTTIKTIIEFVPNCLWHVSGDGFNGRVTLQYTQFVPHREQHCVQ